MTAPTQLKIETLGHRGEGIASFDGGRVFIPRTLPGETIVAAISGNRGQLLAIDTPSPDRIAPFCPHFDQCGGCQLQHMAPHAYAAFKRSLVVEALDRAGISAEIAPLVDARGGGRRRATLHATGQRAGFSGLRSHEIADLDTCPILVPTLANAPAIARDLARLTGPCDVTLTATASGLDVALRGKGLRNHPRLAEVARAHDLARVALNGEVLLSYRPPQIAMGRALVDVPPGGFLQATQSGENVLADLVLAGARGAKRVADLFCGVGPFALRLAEHMPVYAADSERAAIMALQGASKRTKGLKPITAEVRDLFRDPLTRFELSGIDCIVLDPPRAGAEAQVKALAPSKIERIVYVSCDPNSFARDAAILVAAGYGLGTVTPLDQFASSAHVELAAVFSR